MSSLLPQEIIFDILSRLPVKPLLRFRCVSKSWCDLIRNPSFVKMHLQRATENDNISLLGSSRSGVYSIDYNAALNNNGAVKIDYPFKCSDNGIRIVGSCNGLVCVVVHEMFEDDITCIWNPSTKEYKDLPSAPSEFILSYDIYHEVSGFGYDSVSNDYKLVRITYFDTVDSYDCEAHVIKLGSGSWKRIRKVPYHLMKDTELTGMYVNGVLHWIGKGGKVIVSLNLGDEKYGRVPQPNYEDKKCKMNLGVLGGCLCMIRNFHTRAEVWTMKEYGVKESWTRLFTIAQPTFLKSFDNLRLIQMDKRGGILLNDDNKMSLACYYPKRRRVSLLQVRGLVQTYVRSLVSVNSGSYVGQE